MSPSPIDQLLVVVPTIGQRDIAPLLADLVAQSAAAPAATRILVLDNSAHPSEAVRGAAQRAGVEHAHVAPQGVASVRNAALDRGAVVDALLFIDDDERPADGWLLAHLASAQRYGADVVLGPVQVRLPADAPRWLGDGTVLRDVGAQTAADGPYARPINSGNTLVRMAIVQALHARFDTAYDKSGGEDTVFFAELRAAGAVIVWANDALAHELQDPSRMTLRGYTRRRFESGQRAVLLERRLDNATTTQLAPRRAYRIAHGAAVAAGGLVTLRSDRAARGLGELAFGCGSLAGLVGREPHSYAR